MNKREENFKIRTYDVDYKNDIKISSLLNYMQECASNHANELTFGYEYLNNKGLFWVLSRLKLNIYRYPEVNEELKITTWPKGTDKLFH